MYKHNVKNERREGHKWKKKKKEKKNWNEEAKAEASEQPKPILPSVFRWKYMGRMLI